MSLECVRLVCSHLQEPLLLNTKGVVVHCHTTKKGLGTQSKLFTRYYSRAPKREFHPAKTCNAHSQAFPDSPINDSIEMGQEHDRGYLAAMQETFPFYCNYYDNTN